jgi:hypothetical protein
MKITRIQLLNIINESIKGRLKQAFGLGDIFENCFSIGSSELKNKLGSYVKNKANTVGINRTMTTIDRRGDRGDFLITAINDLVDSVDMTLNKSFIDGGEKYQIVYTQSSADFANVGGTFGETLLNLVVEVREIDGNNSRVSAMLHGGDRFQIGGYGTSGPLSGGNVASGAPSVNMDKILAGGVELLRQKFITGDMALRLGTGTSLARGAGEFSRDDLSSNVGKLGLTGVVSNSRLGDFCSALSKLANEFVQAKIEFTVDMALKSAVYVGSADQRRKAIDQISLIDFKIYQAEQNMREYLS